MHKLYYGQNPNERRQSELLLERFRAAPEAWAECDRILRCVGDACASSMAVSFAALPLVIPQAFARLLRHAHGCPTRAYPYPHTHLRKDANCTAFPSAPRETTSPEVRFFAAQTLRTKLQRDKSVPDELMADLLPRLLQHARDYVTER